jgi:peroxisomal 2,4-dienoyl-CoA reductase
MPESPFKSNVLANACAVVTGGASGIGYEISRQMGLHGCSVFICGRRQQVLQEACDGLQAEGISAEGLTCDVRKQQECEQVIQHVEQKHGKLNILVNCAAGNFLAPAEMLTPNGFRTVMEIDALGTFTMSRAAFPALKAAQSSCIINISMTLHYGATWYQVHASAAKAGVDAMTRSLALEWGQFGVRVNGVAPGPIADTVGFSKLGLAGERQGDDTKGIPLGKLGTKWDIAIACVFLASPAAQWVSGTTLVVDGAHWLHREPLVPRDVVVAMSKRMEAKTRKQPAHSKM